MWRNDRGSVTIEAALALSSLVMVAAAFLAGLATMGAYLAATDIAAAAARAHAIGMNYEPHRGTVEISNSGGLITVQASVPSPLGKMKAQAVFPEEIAQGKEPQSSTVVRGIEP
ncbi:hypothetical protein GP475_01545 [Corynebacterium poyangense]|uniref:Uncharacterized protein n=1 Tax=Corynebacterium poyangense TaxID=2684405 RepID=A0A7H0SLN2_9CORY|nr:hypothetical protein [Corynebacterium poyangense]MBZ8177560.1 hypothetical protein [Corynebacterium poyangense]QNQ89457.1 hypothetical protein GP475_01545 [Corynebacterium poyangense]